MRRILIGGKALRKPCRLAVSLGVGTADRPSRIDQRPPSHSMESPWINGPAKMTTSSSPRKSLLSRVTWAVLSILFVWMAGMLLSYWGGCDARLSAIKASSFAISWVVGVIALRLTCGLSTKVPLGYYILIPPHSTLELKALPYGFKEAMQFGIRRSLLMGFGLGAALRIMKYYQNKK